MDKVGLQLKIFDSIQLCPIWITNFEVTVKIMISLRYRDRSVTIPSPFSFTIPSQSFTITHRYLYLLLLAVTFVYYRNLTTVSIVNGEGRSVKVRNDQ